MMLFGNIKIAFYFLKKDQLDQFRLRRIVTVEGIMPTYPVNLLLQVIFIRPRPKW
jgi:hypothetical protein